MPAGGSAKVIHVFGINRAPIRGSFLVSVFGNVGGKRVLLGTEAVLSRWSVKYCANCQTHLEVKTFVGLRALEDKKLAGATYDVEICTRDGVLSNAEPNAPVAKALALAQSGRLYDLEVR